ncbi:MAG: type III secretion system export apparatus subunit SctT [Pseudomonadota bacterium]
MIDELFHTFLYSMFLGFPRVAAAFTVIPFLGRRLLTSVIIRNALALVISIFLMPLHEEVPPIIKQLSTLHFTFLILKEVFIGAIIGFLIAIPFWAIESVGFFIDNQRGATLASSLNPLSGDQTSPLGLMFNQTLTVLFMSSGGFLLLCGLLFKSFVEWPLLDTRLSIRWSDALFFIKRLDEVMLLTVILSAPVVIAMFLSEFCFAIANRFAQQLNVFILSMPVKSGVGFFILVIYVSTLFYYIELDAFSINNIFLRMDDMFFQDLRP